MKRVTGIGGIFFKTNDKDAMREWYQKHLGMDIAPEGYAIFGWRDADNPEREGCSVWSIFADDAPKFAATDAPFMLNYRVENLDALLAALREEGVAVDDKIEEDFNGRFGWITDPEGRRIELWEPAEGY